MAKNNVKTAEAAVKNQVNPQVSEETIEEQIKSENKMDEAALNSALEIIKKEKDEKKARELKDCICMADYVNKRELIEIRKRRAEAEATKEALKSSKELLDKLTSGEITPNEYRAELEKLDKKKMEAFNTADKKANELIKELRENYPTYYCYEWEFTRRTMKY